MEIKREVADELGMACDLCGGEFDRLQEHVVFELRRSYYRAHDLCFQNWKKFVLAMAEQAIAVMKLCASRGRGGVIV